MKLRNNDFRNAMPSLVFGSDFVLINQILIYSLEHLGYYSTAYYKHRKRGLKKTPFNVQT